VGLDQDIFRISLHQIQNLDKGLVAVQESVSRLGW